MTMTARRKFVTCLLWFLPVQLLTGLVLVLHAQPPVITVTEQRLDDHLEALSDRVKRLEDLNIPGRLQVLEVLGDRSWRIELLVIGCCLTTTAHLFLQLWQHRGGGGRRHRRLDDDRDDG